MLQIKPSASKKRQQSVIQSENVKRQLLVQEIQNARCWAERKKKAVARANAIWKENYNPFPDESAATRTNERHGNQRVMPKSNLGVFPDTSAMMFQSDSSASQVSKIKRKSNIVSSATVSRRPFHSHHQNHIQQVTELPFNTSNAKDLTPYHPLREMEIGYTPVLKPNRNKQQCMPFPLVSRNEAHVVKKNTRQLSIGEMISEINDEGSSRDTFLQSQPQRENIFAPSNASAFVRYAPQGQHEYDFSPPVSTPIFETTQQNEFDFYTHDDNLMNFKASSELMFGSPAADFSDYFRESRNEGPPAGGLDLIRSAYSFSQEF